MRIQFVIEAFKRTTGTTISFFSEKDTPEATELESESSYLDVSNAHTERGGYQPIGFTIQPVENGGW